MISLSTALSAMVASLALIAPTTPVAAADSVDLRHPGQLDRGDDVRVPHLDGDVIVDGDLRIEVRNAVTLQGTSGEDYIVSVKSNRGKYRVKRVDPGGETTVLLSGREALYTELSSDGGHLFHTDNRRRATLTAYDSSDGSEVSSARFRGYGFLVDAHGGTAVISSFSKEQTVTWDYLDGGRHRVAERTTYVADVSADRMGTLTGDPYSGGCSVVTTVTDPDTELWRSCRQRVETFSPDGARLTSVHILTDGVGPGRVQLRQTGGTRLVDYDAVWFGPTRWEDADTLLLEAYGKRRGATVRCDRTDCERASDLETSSP